MIIKPLIEDTITGLSVFLVTIKDGKELFVYNSKEALSKYLKNCNKSSDVDTIAQAIKVYTLFKMIPHAEFEEISYIFNIWKENPEFVNKIELEYYNQ